MRLKKVVVIGSGLSSLTAAALLVKKGFAVTVVEKHIQPGGSCGAFRRGKRTFDQGTAMLFGFGEKGFNAHRFLMNEIQEPITLIKHRNLYKLNYDGHPIIFHEDLERYFDQLATLFPEDIEGIRAFYAYIGDLYHHVIAGSPVCTAPTEIPFFLGLKLFMQHPVRQLKLMQLLRKSAGGVLRQFISSPEVIQFFNKITSTYCYTLMDETPAIMAITMFMENHFGGSYYPVGSSQQLPGKLERYIEMHGGTFLYETTAKELVFSGSRVTGVAVENKEGELTLPADAVIYGGTLYQLYHKLIPARLIVPEHAARIKDLKMTYPSVVLYCAVSKEVIPEGTFPIEMFADNPKAIDEKEITLYIFSLADPNICPADEHLVMAIGPSLKEWPTPGSAFDRKAYEQQKRQETTRLIATLERHFPGFSDGIRYSTLATPTTIERFTGKEGGCVAGPKQSMGQELLHRQPATSEWPGVFICGEGTVMGTGSPAVTMSGISAANMVLRKAHKKEYIWHTPAHDVVTIIPEQIPRRTIDGVDHMALQEITNPKELLLHDLAEACQWCNPPACRSACPRALDIRGICRRLEMGNTIGAKAILTQGKEQPGFQDCISCSAPCEAACAESWNSFEGVAIQKLMTELAAN